MGRECVTTTGADRRIKRVGDLYYQRGVFVNWVMKQLFVCLLVLGLGLIGCNNPSATPPLEGGSQVTPTNKTKQLMGTVLHKTWSKTPESWNAGGSDYFVLDVGDAQVEERSAEKGVTLRPSESVSFEEFNRYVGKAVRVEGEYVKATPYVPKDEMEQYLIGPDGNPLPTGSGFKVVVIELLR